MIPALIVLLALALAFSLLPWLRAKDGDAVDDREAMVLDVYRAQLADLADQAARGALTADEAAAARLEVERRLLRATAGQRVTAESRSLPAPVLIIVTCGALVGGVALYLTLGTPDLKGSPTVATAITAERDVPADMAQNIESLRLKLGDAPDNLQMWSLYARSLEVMGELGEAAEIARRIAAHYPDDGDLQVQYAQSLITFADGQVTPAAEFVLNRVRLAWPDHAGPPYFLGLAHFQRGDSESALTLWRELAARSAADAPWLPVLGRAIAEASGEPMRPARTSGMPMPDADAVAAMQALDADDRNQAIRGMVDRLAARLVDEPDDLDGWLRLARAREVLGDTDLAVTALEAALALVDGDRRDQIASELARLK